MDAKETSAIFLAAWLQQNYPQLYGELAKRAGAERQQHLSGFTDVLKSIGGAITSTAKTVASGLSTGLKSVGSFLGSKSGQEALASLAGAYSAINQATIQAQAARAAAGEPPAVIETRYDPVSQSYVPVYSTNGQTYAVNGQVLNAVAPSFLKRYGAWILFGGAFLFFAAAFLNRNR